MSLEARIEKLSKAEALPRLCGREDPSAKIAALRAVLHEGDRALGFLQNKMTTFDVAAGPVSVDAESGSRTLRIGHKVHTDVAVVANLQAAIDGDKVTVKFNDVEIFSGAACHCKDDPPSEPSIPAPTKGKKAEAVAKPVEKTSLLPALQEKIVHSLLDALEVAGQEDDEEPVVILEEGEKA